MVVATMNISESNPERVLLGEPLIDDLRILPHEFPQVTDQVVHGSGAYSPPTQVEFFTESTSLMVGPNMVSFGECVVPVCVCIHVHRCMYVCVYA